jgi:hypothetical protein
MDLWVVLLPVLVPAAVALSRTETIRWLLYLIYCWWLVRRHGPAALKDAAVMAQAFPHRAQPEGLPRSSTAELAKKPDSS